MLQLVLFRNYNAVYPSLAMLPTFPAMQLVFRCQQSLSALLWYITQCLNAYYKTIGTLWSDTPEALITRSWRKTVSTYTSYFSICCCFMCSVFWISFECVFPQKLLWLKFITHYEGASVLYKNGNHIRLVCSWFSSRIYIAIIIFNLYKGRSPENHCTSKFYNKLLPHVKFTHIFLFKKSVKSFLWKKVVYCFLLKFLMDKNKTPHVL